MTKHEDLYQEVTDKIVAALETAGEWTRPWAEVPFSAFSPRNVDGRPYRGVNTILLWIAALDKGYVSPVWGTYRTWARHGAQVRKGERATLVTLWKPTERKATTREIVDGKADIDGKVRSLILRSYNVFNAAQVDGWVEPEAPAVPEVDPIEHAEEFFGAIGADVLAIPPTSLLGASYSPVLDRITIPPLHAFDEPERYYSTLAHEHVHWTGHPSRLARDLKNRFGSEAYAFEELVAELGAAFVGARLGLAVDVREDHAAYVKNWLRVLRDDKKAIFTAGSLAQKATDYLVAAASGEAEVGADGLVGANSEDAAGAVASAA